MNGLVKTLNTDRLFRNGQKLAQQGNFDKALGVFDQALSLNNNYAGIYLHKALALSDSGRHEDAIDMMTKAIDIRPDSAVYYMFLGRIYYDANRFGDSLQAFERSLVKDDRYDFARAFKGLTLLATGKITEGYDLLQGRVNYTNPDFQGRLLVVCESFLNQHQNRRLFLEDNSDGKSSWSLLNPRYAIDKFLLRVRYFTSPEKRAAYMYCLEADRMHSLKQFESAIELSKEALTILPDCETAKEQLCEIYFDAGDYMSAVQWLMDTMAYKEAIVKAKTDSEETYLPQDLHFRLGLIYLQLNDYDKAADYINKVLEPGQSDYEAFYPFYFLGLCNIGLGDFVKARHWFVKATQKPNPKVAERRLYDMMQVETKGTALPQL